MARRQHRQEPEQRRQRHRRARQELGRLHRYAGAEAQAHHSGAELLPLQRRLVRHRLHSGSCAVDHQRHRHRPAPRRRRGGEGFAEQFLGEREVEERENWLQPVLAAEEGAEP
jgi:hypothetical protein